MEKIKIDIDADALLLKSVGEIASENPEKIGVFKKYGVDFCCGGSKTLKDVCEESNIDKLLIVGELNKPLTQAGENDENYSLTKKANDWDVNFLIDYIINIHHTFLRVHIPEASDYVEKIANVHGNRHPELLKIRELFTKMSEAMILHLDKEEEGLLTDIKIGKKENIEKEIEDALYYHEYVGHILKEMLFLSSGYSVPQDACASYKHAYELLKNISDDIMIHVHMENNILFKKII
ncbi:MAG: DUF542 domain-containing protein [bacterium]